MPVRRRHLQKGEGHRARSSHGETVLSHISDGTKRLADWGGAGLAAISLAQVSLVLTIISTLLMICWYGVRFYDRFIGGKPSRD